MLIKMLYKVYQKTNVVTEKQRTKEIEYQEGQKVLIQIMNTSNWEKGRIN